MRNFALFLCLANILWWSWVMMHAQDGVKPRQDNAGEPAFVQGESKLQLLSEARGPGQATRVDVDGSDPQPAPVDAATLQRQPEPETLVAPWCGESTTLQDVAEARGFLARWSQLGGENEMGQVQAAVSSTWWVHLPPLANENETRKKLSELQEKKIDSYYMRSGELSGGISLGVFSRQQSALTVQSDLLKKGYKAEVKEIPRTESRAVLKLKLGDRRVLEVGEGQGLLAGFPQLAIHEIECK